MNIAIINEQNQKLIKRMVESGEYSSPDEVVDTALRLLEERHQKLEALRKDIQKGFDSGEPLPGEQVMEELIGRATAKTSRD
jgi:putative addiction module CopG family antidote